MLVIMTVPQGGAFQGAGRGISVGVPSARSCVLDLLARRHHQYAAGILNA